MKIEASYSSIWDFVIAIIFKAMNNNIITVAHIVCFFLKFQTIWLQSAFCCCCWMWRVMIQWFIYFMYLCRKSMGIIFFNGLRCIQDDILCILWKFCVVQSCERLTIKWLKVNFLCIIMSRYTVGEMRMLVCEWEQNAFLHRNKWLFWWHLA